MKLRKAGWEHPLLQSLPFADYQSVFLEPIGGYCYQLATLLKDVLVQFGYTVEVCAAHVLIGAEVNDKQVMKLPPTHVVLKVTIGAQSYLLAPGMGTQAPRLPILVTGGYESLLQIPDEFRFYYLEQEKLYVLERMTEAGYDSYKQICVH